MFTDRTNLLYVSMIQAPSFESWFLFCLLWSNCLFLSKWFFLQK